MNRPRFTLRPEGVAIIVDVEICDYHRAMKLTFPHPGTLLREELLGPMNLTPYRLAKDIGVPQKRIKPRVLAAA